ncbi:MAG: hypothetical protein ACJAS3_003000 [Roseivirga sp.]|jgi:uncharacterized protein (TIGR00369 family)
MYHTVEYSKTTITELMIPSYANFGGKIHGGTILSLMDKVAYACSAKHAGGYCVTASMNVVDFLAPVEVGDLVHLYASVNHVGSSSVTVGIRVEAESILTGKRTHTNSSYFTMVKVDAETKKAVPVPGLVLETREDMRRFLEAMKRKELVHEYKKNFKNSNAHLDLDSMEELLKGQNCKMA